MTRRRLGRGLSRRQFLAYSGKSSAALLLAACAPRTQEAAPGGPDDVVGGTGTAIFGMPNPPEDFDPHMATLAFDATIVHNTYDGLFRFEGFPAQLVNHLCEDFTVSDDGTVYDFRLRDGVVFHDGTPLTSSDVAFSFRRVFELQAPTSVMWAGIVDPDGISTPDEATLRVELDRPYGPLPESLAWLYVVNEQLAMEHDSDGDLGVAWLRENEAGSGPFRITDFQPGARLTCEHFPDYWRGWPDRHLDGWVFDVTREPATIRLGVEQGNIHLTDLWVLTVDDMEVAEERGAVIEQNPSSRTVNIKMNNQKFPTDNQDFRKACTYAFDYDGVINDLMRGRTRRAYGAYPEGFSFFKSFEGTDLEYGTDLDRAEAHLRRSGIDVNELEPLGYMFRGDDALQRDYGLILRDSLSRIGIEVEMVGVTIPVFLERLKRWQDAPNFSRVTNSSLMTDPDLYCRQYLHSEVWSGGEGQWFSASFYGNNEVDGIIEDAQFVVDQETRAAMYERLQDTVRDDAADIWVDQQDWLVLRTENLKGYEYIDLGAVPVTAWPLHFDPPVAG